MGCLWAGVWVWDGLDLSLLRFAPAPARPGWLGLARAVGPGFWVPPARAWAGCWRPSWFWASKAFPPRAPGPDGV